MTYNYYEEVKNDVRAAILENYAEHEIVEKLKDRWDFEETLHDELWIDDSVTGNASGSYYCNSYKAEESLSHNWRLLQEAVNEFGCSEIALAKGPEYCDVTIRCYLLSGAISEVLDELEMDIPLLA